MYEYDYMMGSSSPSLFNGLGVWGIIAIVAAIIGGICLYFTVFSDKNKGAYTGFMAKLYDFVKFKKMFINDVAQKYIVIMEVQKEKLASAWLSRNSHYYFFVCNNIIHSNQTIPLHCKCGYTNFWKSPHDLSELFCKNCGSEFSLIELEGDCGYVFTSEGPKLPYRFHSSSI